MPTERQATGRYGAESGLIEYIYGITFEIWEQKGVELIRQYYAPDVEMFALSGLSRGVESIVQGTYDTLQAFPDRLLLPENVVWSADTDGDYSSHRILSPMTNLGPSTYGPATNKKVQVRTIADCFVQKGQITREWLIRDTLPMVTQLGFEPLTAARDLSKAHSSETLAWLATELDRLAHPQDVDHEWAAFARQALEAVWMSGDLEQSFPHCTIHFPDPLTIVSGLPALANHTAKLRATFAQAQLSVDHIAVQPWAHQGPELAVRWTLRAKHAGEYLGLPATDKDVYLLGSSHWRVADGQIFTDWTVFDGIGVLAQLV